METIYIDFLDNAEWANVECETCGHWSREELTVYEDTDNEGNILVDYSNEVSCYNWNDFYGTLAEFKEWYVDQFNVGDKQRIEEALKDLW